MTDERTVPGVAEENYWFRRHEVVYQELVPHCAGAVVLEAGCGEGYGADLLARVTQRVVALDCDAATVTHVRRRYPRVTAVLGTWSRCRSLRPPLPQPRDVPAELAELLGEAGFDLERCWDCATAPGSASSTPGRRIGGRCAGRRGARR